MTLIKLRFKEYVTSMLLERISFLLALQKNEPCNGDVTTIKCYLPSVHRILAKLCKLKARRFEY